MKITALARCTGLSVDTIRFYEKMGVLTEEHFTRLPNRYREYNDAAVERLLLVAQAKLAGFTLNEIATWIADWETDRLTRAQKNDFCQRKLDEIDRRIEQLQQIRAYLASKLDHHAPHVERERAAAG